MIRLYFTSFDTELGFDFVTINRFSNADCETPFQWARICCMMERCNSVNNTNNSFTTSCGPHRMVPGFWRICVLREHRRSQGSPVTHVGSCSTTSGKLDLSSKSIWDPCAPLFRGISVLSKDVFKTLSRWPSWISVESTCCYRSGWRLQRILTSLPEDKELRLEEIESSLTPGTTGDGRVQGRGKWRGCKRSKRGTKKFRINDLKTETFFPPLLSVEPKR